MIWNRNKSLKKMNRKENVSSIGKYKIKYYNKLKGFTSTYIPKVSNFVYSFSLPDNTELQYLISNN
jgi:hypothetical protein